MVDEKRKHFAEIAHSGGIVRFIISTDDQGKKRYQVEWTHNRPVPAAVFGVWALREGIPVAPIHMGGVGQAWNPPPHPSCFPVLIGSDSEGKFGYQCGSCGAYWRAKHAVICPYCGMNGQRHNLLTEAQRRYVYEYCFTLAKAIDNEPNGTVEIDMDAVADAVGKDVSKPKFYYAEESQQNSYTCDRCGAYNDILGKVGYCTGCGTRNDLSEFKKSMADIRLRMEQGGEYHRYLQEAVSQFDSLVRQYAKQLLVIPLTARRRGLLEGKTNHNIERTAAALLDAFDIDIFKRLKDTEKQLCIRMFHRRHVYEHNGGEADEAYIEATGDNVRLKEALSESRGSVHDFLTAILKVAENLHRGFHDIFPPLEEPIRQYSERKKRQTD